MYIKKEKIKEKGFLFYIDHKINHLTIVNLIFTVF